MLSKFSTFYLGIFLIFSSFYVFAQPSQPLSMDPSTTGYVTRYASSDTLWVENNCALAVMIPHATSGEWTAFASNNVACMNVVECDSSQECCDVSGSYISGWIDVWSGSWACSGSCHRNRERKYCDGSSETGTWETYTEQAPVGQRCASGSFTTSGYCAWGSWSGAGNAARQTGYSSTSTYFCRRTRPRYRCGSGGSCNYHVDTQNSNAAADSWWRFIDGNYHSSQSGVACSCHDFCRCWGVSSAVGCVYACDGAGGWYKGGCCTCCGSCSGGNDFPTCEFSCSTS